MGIPPTARYIRDAHFQHARFMCTGEQLAEVIATCTSADPELIWWAADVEVTESRDFWSPYATHAPALLGGAGQFLSKVRTVDQFLRGVFLGRRSHSQDQPCRNGGFWTEDDDPTDEGGNQVELRVFDTSYFILYSCDEAILAALSLRFYSEEQQ
ncbi:hypothetical protein L6R49_29840 [Myxococcota bacterium]|nr:hypothetical protein [Myxococcota bacterium]